MKRNKTELVFILDRSGSMGGLEADTIGGYNSMLNRQKQEPGEAFVTTVLFDDCYELLYDRVPLQQVQPITDHDYYVRGCTALLDAMGRTILQVERQAKQPDKVLFVITTDGMENASREFSVQRVRKMVESHQKKGWEFLFLGANMDAISTAGQFGIGADKAVNYHADHEGTALNFEVVTEAITHVRSCAAPLTGSWKKRIEEDFESRDSQ